MVAGERFARLELELKTPAVLAAIAIAREEEGVGDLAAELARHVDESRKPDDEGTRQGQSLGADYPFGICLDDFSLPIDHQPQRSSERHHGKRLERSVQCETTYDQAPLRYYAAWYQYKHVL